MDQRSPSLRQDGHEQIVELSAQEVREAEALADADRDYFAQRSGSYGRPVRARAVVGKLGEFAVEKWSRHRGHDAYPLYRESKFWRQADLILGPTVDPAENPRFA